MAKHCTSCGHEVREGEKFCAECGTPTGTTSQSEWSEWETCDLGEGGEDNWLWGTRYYCFATVTGPNGVYVIAKSQQLSNSDHTHNANVQNGMLQKLMKDGWELVGTVQEYNGDHYRLRRRVKR